MLKIGQTCKYFLNDARGNVAILFGAAAIPLVIGIGAAVDYGRALLMRERMQVALDAATLAIGSWPGLSTADMQTKAQIYFNANLPPSARLGSLSPLNLSTSGNAIIVSVSGSVPTTFMRLANVDHIDIGASTTVVVGMGTVEVALSLDNSGSMAGSKIDALKTAAKDLVDTLFTAAQNSNEPDPIKIALVPFAASVNVGSQYANASWMDTTGIGKYHAYEMKCYANGGTLNSSGVCSVNVGTAVNNFTLFNSLKNSNGTSIQWGGCVEARPQPYDVQDAAPSTSTPETMFVPMFAPDEPDNWTATTSNCTTANGCTFACTDGGTSCSSTSSSLVFNGAPPGTFSYNNYLPDAGANATVNTCSDITTFTTYFTVTIASPAVFTKVNHGLAVGDQVVLSTTGALPTNLTKYSRYYVKTVPTANTFTVSTTSGGAAVNTSGSQSGTHFLANVFTCRSGSANCARSGGSGTTVGQAETTAFGSKNLPNIANCKYGTSANKATISNVSVGGIPGGPNFMCTSAALFPLSTDKTAVKNAIDAMAAQGATSIMEGAMWGWRVLSPGEPFTQGRPYSTKNNQKVLILMTDGQNTYYPNSKFVKSWYDVYGYVARGALGTTSTSSATLTTAMDQRTLQACNNIKAAGIIVYTVAFQIPGDEAGALTLLRNCASDSDKYFAPGTNSELLSAFNAIGQDISELRISH
jgi:Flp pilus assembly protein TadG